ncbi:MAG: UDP-N-acetylglucosamine 1-carboxyvinyltransferase [Dissulfurispiraceae bacterium]|nr:UDP-N-acetylglucosamine 1-carboxyvinyltransferase [Dissulfurispiraceae bacterium]
MDKLIITGNGPLRGEVEISGAKNASLPIITASILASGKSCIKRVPELKDISTMLKLLTNMGAEARLDGDTAVINTSELKKFEAPYELVKTMRASVLVLGPLLARYGRARVSLPGGCAIGARPINMHLAGLEKMGARIELQSGYVIAEADLLRGAPIYFDTPTVTGTENLMMAAALARGTTVLENAACEPEVVDLAECLIKMGARIFGAGTSLIEIEGVPDLSPINNYAVIADRIEAGTFMAVAGATGGDLLIKNFSEKHLDAVMLKFMDAGLIFEKEESGIRVKGPEKLRGCDIKTMPYPGFPTDMQAQFMALMARAEGISLISETVFENRFMHVAELRRMGANISIEGGMATVRGTETLKGAPVMATDLRASASLVIAALCAEGQSILHRVYHLDRGYEQMEVKLKKIGAIVKRSR